MIFCISKRVNNKDFDNDSDLIKVVMLFLKDVDDETLGTVVGILIAI